MVWKHGKIITSRFTNKQTKITREIIIEGACPVLKVELFVLGLAFTFLSQKKNATIFMFHVNTS